MKCEAAIYIGRTAARSGDERRIGTRNSEAPKDDHERREAAERLRVLCVAMTRAKDALPIPGAKTGAQAHENAGALGWSLTAEERALLDDAGGGAPGESSAAAPAR